MGEYWQPVNVTRKEYVDPHKLREGLKRPEWDHPRSATRELIEREWPKTDDVRAISDYGGEAQLWGEPSDERPTYADVSDEYAEISDRELLE